MSTAAAPTGPAQARPHWVRRGLLALAGLAILDYFVLPQLAGARTALHLLTSLQPALAILAASLEAGSLICYSLLTRNLLPGRLPSFPWVLRTDLSSLGVSHLLPGGAATSAALRYRLLQQGGARAQDIPVAMAVEAVGSNLVLAGIWWLSMVASIVFLNLRTLYVVGAVLGSLSVAVTVATLAHHSLRPGKRGIEHLTRCVPSRFRARLRHALTDGALQLRHILDNKRRLRRSAGWAALNLLLDAASLWVAIAAYGHQADIIGLLVAYGLANLVAILPISPGGLGILEAVLIPSLIGFGTPHAIAVLGVVTWRLFNFWAPIPVAGVSYLTLRVQRRLWPGHGRRDAADLGAGGARRS